MMVDDLGRIPMSQHLAATLARAASYADAQSHPEVTLEHLLLALAEDPDAAGVLRSSNVDLARLAAEVSSHIGQIQDRRPPGGTNQVLISHDLKRILEAAAAAARQGRRSEINGAIVLAAIVGDGKSTAAHLLRAQGLTFEQAIRALQRAAAQPPARPAGPEPAPAPAPGSTDQILANARERVQSRTMPPSGPMGGSPVAPAPAMPTSDRAPPPPAPAPLQPAPAEARPEYRPAEPGMPPGLNRSPVSPQWEPAAAAPPRAPYPADGPVSQPPPGRPVSAPPQSIGSPPTQRTQPPSGSAPPMPPSGPPQGARPGPPPQGGMPSPAGPPPSLGQPPPRPPQLQRAPQPGANPPGADPRTQAPPGPRQRSQPGGTVRVAAGQLVENIPRRMRVGIPMVVEARLARSEVKAIAEGLQGGGAVYRHEVTVTKAMSVRLRAPEGGFFIETSSPETQWIENVLGLMADDFASWRWTITPRDRGKQRLQLLISARTVGADGLTAETALPDQVIEVKVAVNYAKTAARWAGWMTAAVIGGILARFGEGLFNPLLSILRGGG
jgi:hypothetical protein